MNAEVYIRRNKLRRMFETEFSRINSSIKAACTQHQLPLFHIKYSPHLLDRAIQREIDELYVFELFGKAHNHVQEIAKFLSMKQQPMVEDELDPNVEYRPLRLEVTDGNLWLGMTVDKHDENTRTYGLCCRMAFINNRRLKGKISTKVIKL